jgi:hypothetical protein
MQRVDPLPEGEGDAGDGLNGEDAGLPICVGGLGDALGGFSGAQMPGQPVLDDLTDGVEGGDLNEGVGAGAGQAVDNSRLPSGARKGRPRLSSSSQLFPSSKPSTEKKLVSVS